MSNESKNFNIEINADAYLVIKEVSNQYNYEDQDVVNCVMKNAFEEFTRVYEEMKNGYIEMAKLNLEISKEFAVSENEALNYID